MIGQPEPVGPHAECEYNLGLLTRRLRSIDLMKLAQGERISRSRVLLQELADLARSAEGLVSIAVPELNPSALADQFDVIGRDLLRYVTDEIVLARVSEQLKELRLAI